MSLRDVFVNEADDQDAIQRGRIYDMYGGIGKACYQLKQDLEMLELVKIANSRTPPIVEVVDDHTQRVIDSIKRVIENLEKARV